MSKNTPESPRTQFLRTEMVRLSEKSDLVPSDVQAMLKQSESIAEKHKKIEMMKKKFIPLDTKEDLQQWMKTTYPDPPEELKVDKILDFSHKPFLGKYWVRRIEGGIEDLEDVFDAVEESRKFKEGFILVVDGHIISLHVIDKSEESEHLPNVWWRGVPFDWTVGKGEVHYITLDTEDNDEEMAIIEIVVEDDPTHLDRYIFANGEW